MDQTTTPVQTATAGIIIEHTWQYNIYIRTLLFKQEHATINAG